MNQQKTGEFLKSLRESKGLTQAQLAEHFYVSSRTVSRWETGSNMPDVDILIDLADFYEVDVREILDGERKSENMDTETGDTMKKVAAYAVKAKRMTKNKVVIAYAACGAITAAVFNILFNKDSVGVLVGIVPETVCAVVIKLVIAAAVVGAAALGLYSMGVFDTFAQLKKNRKETIR